MTIYQRPDSPYWWIVVRDIHGKRKHISTKSRDRAAAAKLKAQLEAQVAAQQKVGLTGTKSPTVETYSKTWVERRRKRGIASVDVDEDRFAHVYPVLGAKRLREVTRPEVLAFVWSLRNGGELADRTIRHVYDALRGMFAEALADGLVDATPCTLDVKRNELPRKRDKDPSWRQTASFTRAEVEALISDTDAPAWRRMLVAMQALAGLRINEATARRWGDIDAAREPLGCLHVSSSYQMKRHEVKATKTGVARQVPIHPTLARMLASWRLTGWAAYQGRQPTDADLIIPSPTGRILNAVMTLRRFHEDLTRLGLRTRRQHDLRRTFITEALAGGATKEMLRWVSHGAEGDVMDLYTTPPWPDLCRQVSALKIGLREGAVTPLLRQTNNRGETDV